MATESLFSETAIPEPSAPKILKANCVLQEHNYSTTPEKMKEKYQIEVRNHLNTKENLKQVQHKIIRLEKKVVFLEDFIKNLKSSMLIAPQTADFLENTFSGVSLTLMQRAKLNKEGKITREKFPSDLRAFALTLQFYSAKAYSYVRNSFMKVLPHPSTLRDWYNQVEGKPGFTAESFEALKIIAANENNPVLCAFLLDEMHIMTGLHWSGKEYFGQVNIGTEANTDNMPLATEALVFMVVALNGSWKIPIAYFFLKGMTGEERGNLINLALMKLYDVRVQVVSITCDGPSCHIAMLNYLGANINVNRPVTHFCHPSTNKPVHILLDACHMLKLIRNAIEYLQSIKNSRGGQIEWRYIVLLHEYQEKCGLRAGNKLKKKHIDFHKQIMKVNIAAQTLSRSVADALEFCMTELALPEFQGATATIEFIRVIDHLFDFNNSRSPFGKGIKAPLRQENERVFIPKILEHLDYLKSLKTLNEDNLLSSSRKTGFLGLYITTLSTLNLYKELVAPPNSSLKYLLTYKFSQDHLELFFASIRSKGGWNNNPTAQQFTAAYKRLLIHNEIRITEGCSVVPQDNTTCATRPLILFATRNKVKNRAEEMIDIEDINLARKYGVATDDEEFIPHINFNLNEFTENIVTYIAGFVITMVQKRFKCATCLSELSVKYIDDRNKEYKLLSLKNRGGLQVPSVDMIVVCSTTEKLLRRTITILGSIPQDAQYVKYLCAALISELSTRNIFVNLAIHFLDCEPETNHLVKLLRRITESYLKIRIHHETQKITENVQGPSIRKKLSKIIIFQNQ